MTLSAFIPLFERAACASPAELDELYREAQQIEMGQALDRTRSAEAQWKAEAACALLKVMRDAAAGKGDPVAEERAIEERANAFLEGIRDPR